MLIIVAIVLLLLLPHPWNLVGFIVAAVFFVGELFLWNRKVRGKPKKTGAQTLIGKEAVVSGACRPLGQVRIGGETWAARCEAGAGVGDTVRIVALDKLTLVVEPA